MWASGVAASDRHDPRCPPDRPAGRKASGMTTAATTVPQDRIIHNDIYLCSNGVTGYSCCSTCGPRQPLHRALDQRGVLALFLEAVAAGDVTDALAFRLRCTVCYGPLGILLGPDEDVEVAERWVLYGEEDPEGGWAPTPMRRQNRAARRGRR